MSTCASLLGSPVTYAVHPECKKYTLRDYGFTESKSGKFQFIRSLNYGSENTKDVQFKLVISKDLQSAKMYTTISLQSINVYKGEDYAQERQNVEALLADMCRESILLKIDAAQ